MIALQLVSLRFDRTDIKGHQAVYPVRDGPGSKAEPANDWERTACAIKASAVLYPQRSPDAPDTTVSIELEALTDIPAGLSVRARDRYQSNIGSLFPQMLLAAKAGERQPVKMTMNNGFVSAGVRHIQAEWIWEYLAGKDWKEFGRSRHDIFVTAAAPCAPWSMSSSNEPWPWFEVLRRACVWAAGATDTESCIDAITRGVFRLGGQAIDHSETDREIIQYYGWSAMTLGAAFKLSTFLDMANRKPRTPAAMNCTDCASAVALLTSALGGATGIIRLDPRPPGTRRGTMATKGIRLIGTTPLRRSGFSFHEVVVLPSSKWSDRRVWDACLQLDFDSAPGTNPPGRMRLSTGLELIGTSSYFDRLLESPADLPDIGAAGCKGLRYPGAAPACGIRPVPAAILKRLQADVAVATPVDPTGQLVSGLGPTLTRYEQTFVVGNQTIEMVRVRLERQLGASTTVIVDAVSSATRAESVANLLRFAEEYSFPLELRDEPGELAFHGADEQVVLMLRGNTVVRMFPADQVTAVLPFARDVDRLLVTIYR